ncbi:MAG: hypothetical protein DLM57_01420 [Pseudonocardiales bacterium]|nr:MAG: hypothetical protein DLM57_01420 [Pseudonocardiales bacterium]
MGYHDTLIAVAGDCPATTGVAPQLRDGRRTVAVLHFELIGSSPYALTQEDVLFQTWLAQQNPAPAGDLAALREQFFDQPRACLRASPLPKRYGWGVHFDAAGRTALHAVDSAEYAALADRDAAAVLPAFRARRAG